MGINKQRFLVVGATGQQGGPVIHSLMRQWPQCFDGLMRWGMVRISKIFERDSAFPLPHLGSISKVGLFKKLKF